MGSLPRSASSNRARRWSRGPAGLEAIESLLAQIERAGERPAAIALELGAGQADDVAELVRSAGFAAVEKRSDLAGIERVVVGRP